MGTRVDDDDVNVNATDVNSSNEVSYSNADNLNDVNSTNDENFSHDDNSNRNSNDENYYSNETNYSNSRSSSNDENYSNDEIHSNEEHQDNFKQEREMVNLATVVINNNVVNVSDNENDDSDGISNYTTNDIDDDNNTIKNEHVLDNVLDDNNDNVDNTANIIQNKHVNSGFIGESLPAEPNDIQIVPQGRDTTVTSYSDTDSNDSTAKHVYGWHCFTPACMQVFNRPIVFLICLCLGVIAQGLTVSGIALASLTSLEKQFGFKSSQVALFTTMYDTAYGFSSILIGYVCTFHKPRFIGLGLLVMMCGAVLITIPKFMAEPYQAEKLVFDDFCNISKNSMDDNCQKPKGWTYQLIFNLGFVICGIGATPLYTLGPAHIDEVTSISTSSVYLGVFYAASAIGPALGFIMAMPLLDTWVELTNQPKSLTSSDYMWVGAWWMGFLIGAGLLLIPIIPMLGLPRLFPNTEEIRAKKREVPDYVPKDTELKLGWSAMKALLKNPSYIFISLAMAAESLAFQGFSNFISKFVETQFSISASNTAVYVGVMGIPGAAGGVLLGGYLVYKFKWNCKQILNRSWVIALLAALLSAFVLVGCDTSDNEMPITIAQLNDTCNNFCNCNKRYQPICTVENKKTYYSPCYAGCNKNAKTDNDTFLNCGCFNATLNITEAINGRCQPTTCPLFPLFIVGIFFAIICTFINNVPLINATFRVVNDGQGAFAIGFQQIFIRFLGMVPSPVMYGSLIDQACAQWKDAHADCGINDDKTSNCLEYKNDYFRYYMFILVVTTKTLACIFMYLAYKFYKLPPKRHSFPNDDRGVDNATYRDSVERTT